MSAEPQEDKIVYEALTSSPEILASWMQEHMSQQLTAYMTGLNDEKMVGRWATGKTSPPSVRLYRLQQGYIAARLLSDKFGDSTARSWFMGTNRMMGDVSPAGALRESDGTDGLKLVPAARAFIEGSFS